VEAPHYDLVEALIRSQRLTEDAALKPSRVNRKLGAVLIEWAARWLKSESRRLTRAAGTASQSLIVDICAHFHFPFPVETRLVCSSE
jgi:hypothetical protein